MQSAKQCSWGLRLVLLGVILLSTTRANAAFIGLGQAGKYSLFCVSNTQWQMNNSVIHGRLGAGPGVTYNWSGSGGPYDGPVDYQTGGVVPPVGSLGGSPTPTVNPTDMTQAVLDARAAAASAASLTPNLTTGLGVFELAAGTTTITGNGPGSENVIDVAQVNMSGGTLLLSGTPSETFIVRVAGIFNVTNASVRVTGGMPPSHVLWYLPAANNTIKSPNGAWDGTILALNSGVQFDNTPSGLGFCNGAIIASDDAANNQNYVFSVVSGFDLNSQPFVVPEPATLGALAISGLLLIRRSR